MSFGEDIDRWKVDPVGKFVDAGHEGVADEGGGRQEKRTNHNTLSKVDNEYIKLPIAGTKGEIVMETVVATFTFDSRVADDEESLLMERPGSLCKGEKMAKEASMEEDSNNNKKDDLTEPIDASNVTFACQDVRLKPGFVMPVKVKKPKIVVEKKVVVDAFYDYLASPGECVIIPDVAEESWMEATDEELGQELADKLKEDKVDVIVSLVAKFGRNVVLDIFWETQKIEESGGLMIMNGARRRSSGGVLFHLLRGTKDEKIRAKVAEFFEERQNIDSRREKKRENGVKEFTQERSLGEKDLVKKRNIVQQEQVFNISALFE